MNRKITALFALVVSAILAIGAVGFASSANAVAGTAAVTVTVVDLQNNPIPDAAVSLNSNSESGNFNLQTDADGVAQFDSVGADSFNVIVSSSGFATTGQALNVAEGQQYALAITMSPATSEIDGTVTNSTGEVLGGAFIYAPGTNVVVIGSATGIFDTDGALAGIHFSIPNLGPDTYSVTASAPGYISETRSIELGVDAVIGNVDFVLDPQPVGSVSGRVTDAAGHGIGHIFVSVLNAISGMGAGFTHSSDDGTFSVPAVAVGDGYTIEFFDGPYFNPATMKVRSPAYETLYLGRARTQEAATTFSVAEGADSAGKNIRLDLGATITGHINLQAADGTIDLSPDRNGTDPLSAGRGFVGDGGSSEPIRRRWWPRRHQCLRASRWLVQDLLHRLEASTAGIHDAMLGRRLNGCIRNPRASDGRADAQWPELYAPDATARGCACAARRRGSRCGRRQ
jgi:Carboxypeptidase regulatory-like domain